MHHDFPTFDIVQRDQGLVSVRSNEYGGDLNRLARTIDSNAFAIHNPKGPINHYDAAGQPLILSPQEIRGTPKALLQVIPHEPPNGAGFAAFLRQVRDTSRRYRMVIRIAPMHGFKSSGK